MEYGDEADFGAQVFGRGRDGAQGLGGGVKQDVVNHGLILVGNYRNLLGQREDRMEIFNGNKVCLTIFQPLRAYQ